MESKDDPILSSTQGQPVQEPYGAPTTYPPQSEYVPGEVQSAYPAPTAYPMAYPPPTAYPPPATGYPHPAEPYLAQPVPPGYPQQQQVVAVQQQVVTITYFGEMYAGLC